MRGGGTTWWVRSSRRSTRRRRPAVAATHDAERAAVDDVDVAHRGPHIFVAEQYLNRSDVGARPQLVGSEAVAEGVACRALSEPRRASGIVHRLFHCRLVVDHLSASRWTGARAIDMEELLPGDAGGCSWHLRSQAVRQVDLAATSRKLATGLNWDILHFTAHIRNCIDTRNVTDNCELSGQT